MGRKSISSGTAAWLAAAAVLAVTMTLSSAQAVAAEAPPLIAWAPCPWGSADCNVCVPDAAGAITVLRTHPERLGFHMNGASDPSLFNHWEGVQRLMSGGGRYLAVSRVIEHESEDVSFVIVEMASRNDQGLRFRSNRLDPGRPIAETEPPSRDRIVLEVPHEPGFTHAGGMQALGHFLAVPFESGGASKVVFYDVADPLHPVRLSNVVDHTPLSPQAGTATLGKLADGRFLLVIGRKDADILDFYVSAGTDLATTGFEHFDTWWEDELSGGDTEFGNYQTLNLVAQCDGTVYMVGIHRNLIATLGQDFVDLFRLDNAGGNHVAITKVASKHLFCDEACNLDAAGGAYIDPEGRLYIYGTTHTNDGTDGTTLCPVVDLQHCSNRLAEFRPVPHGTCTRIEDAWAELYADTGFSGRSLMIDFVDRDLENYSNLNGVEDFEDRTSSVRWCLPEGATFRLWQHRGPCREGTLDLVGDGTLRAMSNVSDASFGDAASCAEWLGGPFARAGEDASVECQGPTTPVQLDGRSSVSVSGGPLSFLWHAPNVMFDSVTSPTPTGAFPFGATPATLTVADSAGSDQDDVTITVVDTLAPTITCPADLVVDAIMPAGAPVIYPPPAAADSCSVSSVVCSQDSGSVFGVGTTTVQCDVTDGAGHGASCSFTVRVKSAAEQLAELIAEVTTMSGVAHGTRNSLLSQLESALAAIESERQSRCGKLGAFINHVNALRGKKLTEAQALALLEDAERIQGAAGCL